MHGGREALALAVNSACSRSARVLRVVTGNVWFMRKGRDARRQGSQGSTEPSPGVIGAGVSSGRRR